MFGRNRLIWFFAFAMAAVIGFVVVPKALSTVRSYGWKEAPCVIIDTMLMEDTFKNRQIISAIIRFSYEWEGKKYESGRYGTDRDYLTGSPETVQSTLQQYRKGAKAICFVNPNDPREAVLERGDLWALLFLLGPFLLVGIIRHEEIIGRWERKRRMKEVTGGVPLSETDENSRLDPRLFFMGCLFLVIGTFFLGFEIVGPLMQWHRARHWVETEATIRASELKVETGHHGPTYSLEVSYEYRFGNKQYLSDRKSFQHEIFQPVALIEMWCSKHPPGTHLRCWVDPQNPYSAVLERNFHIGWIEALFALGFPLGVWTLIGAVRRPYGSSKLRGTALDAFWRSPIPLSDPGSLVKKYGIWIVLGAGAGTALASVPAIYLLRNGIRGLRLGRFDLLNLAYGFGAACLCGWLARQCFKLLNYLRHPPPVIQFSPEYPRVGESFLISWKFRNPSPRGFLRLQLEGVEQAKIRRIVVGIHGSMSDEQLQERIFSTVVVCEGDHQFQGQSKCSVPHGSMHSFRGVKGAVVWRLRAQVPAGRSRTIDYIHPMTIRP